MSGAENSERRGFFETRRGMLLGALGLIGAGAGTAVVEEVWKRKDMTARLFNDWSIEKFELAAVPGLTGADGQPLPGFSAADLAPRRSVLNLWASYCPTCHEEHHLLMELAKQNLAPIYGADVKDRPEHAKAFLERYGNPFAAVGADDRAFLQRALGVRGVPATFVVGPGPKIEASVFGPLDEKIIATRVLPALTKT